MRVLFCPTSFVRTKLSNLETDLGRCLHFSYGPLRAKERYLIQTFPRPFHRADDHHPTFIMDAGFPFPCMEVWGILGHIFLATVLHELHPRIYSWWQHTPITLYSTKVVFSFPQKFERNWPKKIWNVVDVANADHAHRFYMRWNTAVDQQTSSCKGWWDK